MGETVGDAGEEGGVAEDLVVEGRVSHGFGGCDCRGGRGEREVVRL